jgi:hypothetical protein
MEWAAEAARDNALDPTARLVLVMLAYHASPKWGRCYAGAELISTDTGFSTRTVWDAMARIRAAKVVDCDVRAGQTTVWYFPTAPLKQVQGLDRFEARAPGNPGSKRHRPLKQIQDTPEAASDEQVIEQEKLTRSDAAARRPGDAVAPGEKPDLRVITPGVAFAPGTGRIPNWSRGEQ